NFALCGYPISHSALFYAIKIAALHMDGFGSAAAWLFRAGRRDVYYLRCAPGQCGCLVAVDEWKSSCGRRLGAWVGHEKSVKFAKYCKQRILVAISSH
ncbi:hypothetical protein, partial [Klebsiella pneumoniae]|uniref:hypothetical protein n=1 Tax=Klebsiella pneumoniae TaxID=573 RepID=UPI003CEDBDB5